MTSRIAQQAARENGASPTRKDEVSAGLNRLSRWQTAALAAVCLLAVALRLLFAWWFLPPLESDFYWYRLAGLAASQHGLASLFSADPPVPMWVLSLWPPGYPLFLGLLYSVTGSIWVAPIVQSILGGLSCIFVFAAARRWGANPWAAAGTMALYPHAIVYSAIHGAETLAIFLLSIALFAGVTSLRTRRAVGYGLSLGLAILTRCHTMLLMPGVILSLWSQRRALVVVLCCVVLVLAPWAVSRSVVYHRPVFMTTFFGHLLYMGNYAENTTGGYYEVPTPIEIPGDVTPPEEDVYYTTAGVREILLHPWHYVLVSARRIATWTGVDRDEWMQKYAPRWLGHLSLFAQLLLFFAAAAASIESWRDPRARHVVWPALSLVLLTALTYHMPRYTLVALPYFALIAARLRIRFDGVADAAPAAG